MGLSSSGQGFQVDVGAPVGLDAVDRVVQHGQVPQPEEVHLQQAERLARGVVELGDDRAVGLAFPDGDVVDDRLAAHDHAGRVHAGLADQPLEPAGGVDDLPHLGLGLVQGPDLAGLAVPGMGLVEDPGQRDVLAHHGGRERLGDPVAERVREAEHPGRVLDGGLGLDGAVGDDLRDPVIAPLLGDVADHVTPPAFVEVDVDVGHGHALGIQEPLEDQPVLERVQVGDAQGVGHQAACGRAAARADPDPVALGPHDEVGHDQEVRAEAHLGDDAHLVLDLLPAPVVIAVRVPAVHPAPDLLPEPALLGLPVGHVEQRHQVLALERDVGPLGDEQGGVTAGLPLLVRERRPHLLRGLQVVARAVELEPPGVGHVGAGLHAEQHLVRFRVGLDRVVRVVGDHERQVQLFRDAPQAVADPLLDAQAVVHDLDEEVARAEDVPVGGGRLERLRVLAEPQPGLHLAAGAAGGGDDALGVRGDQLTVHPRLAEVALQRGQGGQPEQVVHALGGLGEQRHVRVGTGAGHVVVLLRRGAPADRLAVPAVLGRDVGLDADDRLDPGLGALGPEIVGPVEVAVVGHGHGGHALALALGEHVLQPRGPVQHRVLGVHVEVHKPILVAGVVRCGCRHELPPPLRHATKTLAGTHQPGPGESAGCLRSRACPAGEFPGGRTPRQWRTGPAESSLPRPWRRGDPPHRMTGYPVLPPQATARCPNYA